MDMVTVCTELTDETVQSLGEIAEGLGRNMQETLRLVIFEGIASLRTEEKAGKLDGLTDSQKVGRLLTMLKDADADYASLKFQNFTLFRDNKTLELNLVGYRSKVESLEGYIRDLKDEIARLRENGF